MWRCALMLVVGVLAIGVAAAEADPTVAPVGHGQLASLSAFPGQLSLRGQGELQQLVVTGHYANGGVRDLTHEVNYINAKPSVARVGGTGLLTAIGNGSTKVVAQFDGRSVQIPVSVVDAQLPSPISFTNDIVPIFSKLGCNAGACHGKASGQYGFKLSLLGFEPEIDFAALAREGRGRRLLPAAPGSSLLVLKATGAVGHGGGGRLERDSREYRLLLRWIGSGAPFGRPSDPKVVHITVSPERRLVARKAAQQLAVTAHYSDGSRRDVTTQVEYSSNDPEIVGVGESGLIETLNRPGEGAVMVRFLGHVAVSSVTIPQQVPTDAFPTHPQANFIDKLVFAKLRQLGVPPSVLCSDGEFLRRASIDITGTLPSADEVETFLADANPDKRRELVERLLEQPAYASYFALKWGDILRNRRNGLVHVGGGSGRTEALHGWIRQSISDNRRYDEFVRQIVMARGDAFGEKAQPPVGWYNVLKEPTAIIDDLAQVFLGTRIQCAQCHHHPYENWSQDDYWGLAAFFARVKLDKPKGKLPKAFNKIQSVVLMPEGSITNRQGKEYTNPRVLGGEELSVPKGEDPRTRLADWMTRPDNPFLARALVNRYWAHFFSRGIVEMADDLRVTNPPSNPALLEALAQDFVAHEFDVKHLIRTIATSTTYQLSSRPNDYNASDDQNFARYYMKRLPAEAFADAIDRVTGVATNFSRKKNVVMRAIDLPDESVNSPLLAAFGKPVRASACECERSDGATLNQRLFMITSQEIHKKLKDRNSRAAKLAADSRPLPEKIDEIYRLAFARTPTAEEMKTIHDYLNDASRQSTTAAAQEAYEDVLWALINTKEFQFNH